MSDGTETATDDAPGEQPPLNGKASFEIEDGKIRLRADFGERCRVELDYDGKDLDGTMWRSIAQLGVQVNTLAMSRAQDADEKQRDTIRARHQADLDALRDLRGGFAVPPPPPDVSDLRGDAEGERGPSEGPTHDSQER